MGLLWNLDRRAEVGHHLVRVETAHIVAWRRPLAHHDLGNRFVAIDGADIDIVIEWIAPERIPAAPPPTAVEPPRRPPETVRAGAEGTIDISPRLSIGVAIDEDERSEEHTSELQSLMRISYAVFCLKKNKKKNTQ